MSSDKLAPLLKLQEADLEIERLTKDADAIPATLATLESELSQARATADVERGRLADNERAQRALQGQIELDRDKVKQWEARLPQLKHPREYAALQREVDAARRSILETEERIASHKTDAEPIRTSLKLKEDEQLSKESVIAEGMDTRASEEAALRQQADKLITKRKKLKKGIEPRLLATYELLRTKRRGTAMVAVKNQSCSGCNRKLAPQTYNRLVIQKSVEQCPSCLRLVYMPDEPETVDAK